MILRARFVLPIAGPPIENGAVVVCGETISAVGSWPELRRDNSGGVADLGDAVILPGLINAHCHLDYTDMVGLLPPRRSFSSWIKSIVALKSTWSDLEFKTSWRKGAEMLLRSGTTTVLDIEAVFGLLPAAAEETPLNVISCHEIMSLRRQIPELVRETVARVEAWTGDSRGLSPHAPYTTSADLLSAAGREAAARNWLLTSHVAESQEEYNMFAHATGALYDWLSGQRDMSDCGRRTPVQHVDAAGALAGMIVAHANYVTSNDIELMAKRGASVAHCPRSHDYFQHQPFQYEQVRNDGVNVCLGTDSLATVHIHSPEGVELDMFSELRCFARCHPQVAPKEIAAMATINGAKALGREGRLGALLPGARADIIAISGTSTADPCEALLNHRGPVSASMIRGEWIIQSHERLQRA